jgi:predicted transcriptional regulator
MICLRQGIDHCRETIRMNAKEAVKELLTRLPQDCTIEDVQYHLYVLQAIQRGRQEIACGKRLDHEKVVQKLRGKWQKKLAGK